MAMQSDNRIIDDLTKLATGALGALQGVQGEFAQVFRHEIERILADMALVSRDEFDAVKAMAAAARSQNDVLVARIVKLESELAARGKGDTVKLTARSPNRASRKKP
jgi:BMFP domain-containing protein YqiC